MVRVNKKLKGGERQKDYSDRATQRARDIKNFTQESRPKGTDPSRNVMLTGKSKVEQEEIQTKNALEGIMRNDPSRAAQIASQSTTNAEIMNRINEEAVSSGEPITEEDKRAKEIAPELAKIGEEVAPSEEAENLPTDLSGASITRAGASGAASVVPFATAVAGSIAGGAAAGSVVPVIGTALGAAAGLGVAAYSLSKSVRQNIGEVDNVFRESSSYMNSMISDANAGVYNGKEAEAIQAWNQYEANIKMAEKKIKIINQKALAKFTGEGGKVATDIAFYLDQIETQRALFRNAVLTPNPNFVTGSSSTQGEQTDSIE